MQDVTASLADAAIGFDAPDAMAWLEAADDAALDALPFGVVRMARDATVLHYNATESRMAGIPAEKVLGRHFFSQVAPCTDNDMISGRYAAEPELDSIIPYVFTLRMRPTPVRLRLLRAPAIGHLYLLIERS
jgi:photoactive yellow protein